MFLAAERLSKSEVGKKLVARKKEEATCSFHFLTREVRGDDNQWTRVPISRDEFAAFCQVLIAQPEIDIRDPETCRVLRNSLDTPVEHCEIINDRTIFGRFRSKYTGHAYENTDVGEISDSSVSLRPFFFIAYLSESGIVYVGSQYLGTFGGYGKLERTLRSFLPGDGVVVSHSFRNNATSFAGAQPKEIRVNFARQSKELTGATKFGERGAMTFKRASSKDEHFKNTVVDKILSKVGQPRAALKSAVAGMLSDNEMLHLRDEDIENCTVVAVMNGKDTTINIIEASHYATKFPLGIKDYVKGHPDREKTQAAMLRLLQTQIISRSEIV
jgi:hypothetical protein